MSGKVALIDSPAFRRHRKADPHCTCNDCQAWHAQQATTGPTNLIELEPLKDSSGLRGHAMTMRALVVTRGRDRQWARAKDVLYIEQHARLSEARKTFPKPTVELALTYADAEKLIRILQKELNWYQRQNPNPRRERAR